MISGGKRFDGEVKKVAIIQTISVFRYNFDISEELNSAIDDLIATNDLDNCIIAYEMMISCKVNIE